MMMRASFLGICCRSAVGSWAVFCSALSSPALAAGEPRNNVLFIVADDLRAELGSYGVESIQSPNIDALARRGVLFNRAYCQQAVCNPSRASALTGLRPDTIGVWDLAARFRETAPNAVTLPEYFKRHGYFTQGIGKILHNEVRPLPNRVSMTDPDSWSVPPTFATGAHWQDWVIPGDPDGPKEKGEAWQCLDVPDEAYFDGKIAEAACAAIEALGQRGAPFFLAVGFWKPHLPFNAPRKYWELYDRSDFLNKRVTRFPKGAPEIARHDWSELRSYQGVPKEGPLTDEQAAELRHGYYACVSFLDAQVGRLLDQLERFNLADKTVVVLWGDHGFHLGEQDLWAKTSNYELDARVPLIVAAPGMDRGSRTNALVELVDLFPTLVDLVGLPVLPALDGISFKPQLEDASLPGKKVALTQHPQPFYRQRWAAMGYALRTDQFRYVEWRDRSGGQIVARELYDHAVDALESNNLIEDASYAGTLHDLEELAARTYRYVARP